MHSKKAYLIINPHGGQDMTRFPDIMTVFAAAGWKVDNVLVEYGGQEKTLAEKAIPDGYQLLIAHGGDGTVSKIMEAVVMASQEKEHESKKGKDHREHMPVVGAISGGTANQWVHEIGYPTDPVQAALALINSDVQHVDVGRISVERIVFPAAQHQKQKAHEKAHRKSARYFLLTAGFGIDAAIISHTSKSLKERIGSLAYEVAATKELPEQHPFYVEIFPMEKDTQIDHDGSPQTQLSNEQGKQEEQGEQGGQGEQTGQAQNVQPQMETAWRGKAIQIVVGNTRRYGDDVVLNPDAYIDDGKLNICVMTDVGAIKMTQQVASLLLRKQPENAATISLQDAHFTITLPAHVGIQLDGGSVALHHFLSASEQDALEHQTDPSQVLVTYRIDVMPQAVAVAVPRTYDNTLFSQAQTSHSLNTSPVQPKIDTSLPDRVLTEQHLSQGQIDALIRTSQLITVVGMAPDPAQPQSYIIAGTRREDADTVPVAMRINADTPIHTQSGEPRLPRDLQDIQPGSTLYVEGKMNKRGVISVSQLVVRARVRAQ